MVNQEWVEPSQKHILQPESDVIVCGGGPSGVAAAVAAARSGARTRLFELQGCLGGVWTAGLLSIVLDARGKQGFQKELILRLEKAGEAPLNYFYLAGSGKTHDFIYDPELMKYTLEDMTQEAGVNIQLHTRVVGSVKENGHLKAVITESKSGRQVWPAKIFIDSTGDGDLAAHSGCSFEFGRPDNDQTQPMSMVTLLVGLDPLEVAPFTNGHPSFTSPGHYDHETKLRLADALRQAGSPPSYSLPVLFHIRENLFAFCANHEYQVSGLSADQISYATLHARKEVHTQIKALRRMGGPWKNVQIAATPSHIGVREGRRINGVYKITINDLIEGKHHPDAVCRVNFPVDVHATDPSLGTSYGQEGVKSLPYDIPLRALIAKDVQGLILAGRCISGDFLSHASYRVTGNAIQMGQFAGCLAGLAVQNNSLPPDIHFENVNKLVKENFPYENE